MTTKEYLLSIQNKSTNVLVLSKSDEVITHKNNILNLTSFLDGVYNKISWNQRIWHVVNENFNIKKCPSCNTSLQINKANTKKYNVYCSAKCRVNANVITSPTKDSLYNDRIILKKSIELIASENNVSSPTVNKWIIDYNIPIVKYNEANSLIKSKLSNKELMTHLHKNEKKTYKEISKIIGGNCSCFLVGFWMEKHGIVANNSNSYPRKINKTSKQENILFEYVKSLLPNDKVLQSNRSILKGNEIDIYIPSKNFAIEYNGIYYHQEKMGKDRKYHLTKTKLCESKGIRLFHIWEDMWLNNMDIVKSMIKSMLGLNKHKIFARKCIIKNVSVHDKNIFLESNHIQSKDKSKVKLGLYLDSKLISIMTFSKPRYNSNYQWELSRFASSKNITVVGGFSKLLSSFVKNYNPTTIISYADRGYSQGNVYSTNGFKLIDTTLQGYWYTKNGIRYHRSNFSNNLIKKKFDKYDPNLSGWENMQLNGYDRIWNSGQLVYVYTTTNTTTPKTI